MPITNPSTAWDTVGIYGWYRTIGSDAPAAGTLTWSYTERVQRVDGRGIYPAGDTHTVTIGDLTQQDPGFREQVRAALRALAAAEPGFDAEGWDEQWQADLACAVFVLLPPVDDPDIGPAGWKVRVEERFDALRHKGRMFDIEPSLAHMQQTVPGLNLGTLQLPTTSPTGGAVALPRGVPLGLASLDEDGKVPVDELPDGLGGGFDETALEEYVEEHLSAVARTGAYSDLTGQPTIPTVPTTLPPTNASVTPAKIATGYALPTTAQVTKLDALPADAQSAAQVAAAVAPKADVEDLADKAAIGLVRPEIRATSATACPDRATWIATHCPGYTGPVVWHTGQYAGHPGPTTSLDGDDWIRRAA